MTLNERVDALTALGQYLSRYNERTQAQIHRASVDNPWFTPENIRFALDQIVHKMLNKQALESWTKDIIIPAKPKRVGVIMAGNIPAVGFHDLLCVFVSGNITVVKLSEKDKYLIPFLIKVLGELDTGSSEYFEIFEKLRDFDAVIATGSNNSARYFEYYFADYPHIIRRNRNAVALLDGTETDAELAGLSDDIFMYFGMGCRNVSHCFVPEGYDFTQLISQLKNYDHLVQHNKYKNNLDYNLALQILNKSPHTALPNLILLENPALISPVSCLHYSYYHDRAEVHARLKAVRDEIQCVVTGQEIPDLRCVKFGTAQQPALDDYADGVNTLAFLQTLNT